MVWIPSHTEAEVRDAVLGSPSLSGALRRLGLRAAGGNFRTLKKLIAFYGISTDHLDPNWVLRGPRRRASTPLHEILVEGSTYNRWRLKNRLYAAGLKQRACELCGQDETWCGRPMALILDHINGVGDDNRIENLRIVCPNCAATLDTHCGRKNRIDLTPRSCRHCGESFLPKYPSHRYCSQACGVRSHGSREPQPDRRKVQRPPYDQLMAEIEATSYSAVGRRYGVSDNAVRKWVRWYRARAEGEDGVAGAGPAGNNSADSGPDPPHRTMRPADEVHEAAKGVSDDPVSRTMATILR